MTESEKRERDCSPHGAAMNNEELKKKVVEILFPVLKGSRISCNEENACKQCWFPCEVDRLADSLADALIAAGIGDVSSEKAMRELAEAFHREKCAEYDLINYKLQKAEHRAEVAKRAMKDFTVQVGCRSCPYNGKCGVSNPSIENGYQECYDAALRIAEKELAEESGGKKEV